MTELDRLLSEAGERWRGGLAPAPNVDPSILVEKRSPSRSASGVVSIAALGLLAVAAFVIIGRPILIGGTTVSAECDVTIPSQRFAPPPPAPEAPSEVGAARWYGTPALWTMIQADGETWKRGIVEPHTITRKTFWWSEDWSPTDEPQPAIQVTGERLDGDGTFVGSRPTVASAGFGTAMLVGVDLPAPGCWKVTGTYRGATLSYIVLAPDN